MKKMLGLMISAIVGIFIGAGLMRRGMQETLEKTQMNSDKFLALFRLMNRWVKIKQEKKNVSMILEKKGYRNIAVYGMSSVGETLVRELQDTDISVAYGIDKNSVSIYAGIDVFSLEDDLKMVDAIVVTAITYFDEIEENLRAKVKCPIISLEEILNEL